MGAVFLRTTGVRLSLQEAEQSAKNRVILFTFWDFYGIIYLVANLQFGRMARMLLGFVVVGLVGIVSVVFGLLLWKKEKISLLHGYHCENVSAEDKTAFCTVSGIGVFIIGIGLLVTAILLAVTESVWSFLAFAIGFMAGLALLIWAGIRYNSKD